MHVKQEQAARRGAASQALFIRHLFADSTTYHRTRNGPKKAETETEQYTERMFLKHHDHRSGYSIQSELMQRKGNEEVGQMKKSKLHK